MHGSAMAPQRRADRANAGAAGSLLPPQLAARTGEFALVLGLVRTAAQPGEIPPRSFVQQVRIDLGAEYGVGQLDFADFLSVQIDYIHDWHNLDSFFVFLTTCYFALCDFLMKMYCPLAPGTDPRTRSRFSSESTLIT